MASISLPPSMPTCWAGEGPARGPSPWEPWSCFANPAELGPQAVLLVVMGNPLQRLPMEEGSGEPALASLEPMLSHRQRLPGRSR